jgi:hypothetical protein
MRRESLFSVGDQYLCLLFVTVETLTKLFQARALVIAQQRSKKILLIGKLTVCQRIGKLFLQFCQALRLMSQLLLQRLPLAVQRHAIVMYLPPVVQGNGFISAGMRLPAASRSGVSSAICSCNALNALCFCQSSASAVRAASHCASSPSGGSVSPSGSSIAARLARRASAACWYC